MSNTILALLTGLRSRSEPRSMRRARVSGESGYSMIELVWTLVVVGILAAIVIPKVQDNIDRAKVGKAIGDMRAIQADIDGWAAGNGDEPPTSLAQVGRGGFLDPWGNPYVYVKFDLSGGPPGNARKDRFGVDLNTTYDLYSSGKDAASSQSLTAGSSQDDVVRGLDGGYLGLGKKY